MDETPVLLDEITLPSARGGRRMAAPLLVEVVRALGEADLEALQAPVPLGAEPRRVLALRHSHHQLARLVAQGLADAEASLISGYSPSYICILKDDPAFAELVSYYAVQREQIHVVALERMGTLGISSLDELQRRLDEAPERWANRELMELAELLLVKPGRAGVAASGGNSGAGGVTVNVKFVSPGGTPGPVIDVTPETGS